ncbi:hypothetical protein [Flavobacterium gilvum]|uniref:Uncharacterized protein n=1 Tax=Flavobacterium gilvum TaxID=1492737 RepID=A0AAC9I3K4_9FLAO|nr:hypothetical protein [Flavobacterium gilvum]AOW09664.1 hypothetical protein EM308_09195 [Flavobacterium gilvum]KFC60808.1 hypothetical protein FEM08_04200 [Flavobacterium gilvum]
MTAYIISKKITSAYKFLVLLAFIVTLSCSTKYNSYPNREYEKAAKTYSGQLTTEHYNTLIKELERELKTTIPRDKSILINYQQDARNCILIRFDNNEIKRVTKNIINISKQMTSENNAVDYFVYKGDSPLKQYYPKNFNLILDSGYFANNVFTNNEICAAFFIVKPNGKFMTHFGDDYFTEVQNFLQSKD